MTSRMADDPEDGHTMDAGRGTDEVTGRMPDDTEDDHTTDALDAAAEVTDAVEGTQQLVLPLQHHIQCGRSSR